MQYIKVEAGYVTENIDTDLKPGPDWQLAPDFNGHIGISENALDRDNGYTVKTIDQQIAEGLIEDNRGVYYHIDSKQRYRISQIGESIPKGYTTKKPSGFPYERWENDKWVEDLEEKVEYELNLIRIKRISEFSQFDKYQLPLLWSELSESHRSEYTAWRSAWLDAPTTGIEPERPEWFI